MSQRIVAPTAFRPVSQTFLQIVADTRALAARPEFWLLILLAWTLLSAARSAETPWARAAGTEALRWGAGIGLALALGLFFRRVQAAARAGLLLATALSLAGIAAGESAVQGGLTGPYRDHQLYGSVLLLFLPLLLAQALTAREAAWRLGALAALSAGTLCLGLSQTRSAWAGLLAAALVFGGLWLAHPARRQAHRGSGRRLAVTAAVFAAGLGAAWLLLAPTDLRAPLAARAGTLAALGTDESWQTRLSVWQGAARLTAAHPWIGIGLGRYPGQQHAWTGAGRILSPSDRPSLSEEAHSFYWQTAAETGLIGLGLYAAALASFACAALRRLHQTRRSRWGRGDALLIASLSCVAGQAVDAFASPSWQFAEASLLFWALLGLGLAALGSQEPEPAAAPLSPASFSPASFSPASFSPVPFSPALRRRGRLALSGGLAVLLAANVLPLGLLTPVEAYTPPTGAAYQSAVIAGTAQSAKAGDTVYFTLTATYTKAGTTYRQNVSTEPTTQFYATQTDGGTAYGTFQQDAAGQRVAYVVPASLKGKTVTVSAVFQNGSQSRSPATTTVSLTVSP